MYTTKYRRLLIPRLQSFTQKNHFRLLVLLFDYVGTLRPIANLNRDEKVITGLTFNPKGTDKVQRALCSKGPVWNLLIVRIKKLLTKRVKEGQENARKAVASRRSRDKKQNEGRKTRDKWSKLRSYQTSLPSLAITGCHIGANCQYTVPTNHTQIKHNELRWWVLSQHDETHFYHNRRCARAEKNQDTRKNLTRFLKPGDLMPRILKLLRVFFSER